MNRIALLVLSFGLTFSVEEVSSQVDSAKIDRKDYKVQRQHDDFERTSSWSLQGFDVLSPPDQMCFFSVSLDATRRDGDSAASPNLSFVTGVGGPGGTWGQPPDSLLFLISSQRIGISRADARPMANGWFTVFGLSVADARQLAAGSARGRIASSGDRCDFSWSERDALLLRLFLRRELHESM